MAVNRRRGEVEAVIDGKPLRLCLTLGALAELEDAFGASDLQALAGRFAGGRLSARDLLVIAGGDYFGLTDPAMPMPLPGVRIDHDTRTFDVSDGRLVRSVVYTTGGGPSFVYETTVLDLPCTDPSDVAGPEPHVAVRPTFTAWPNPASTTQQIRFRIAPGSEFAKDGSTLLSIYDANGRSVRTLTADATAEGEVIAEWDGADGNGFRVPSGVYWAGLRSAGVAAASGVVIRVR